MSVSAVVALIPGLLTTNFYLGKQQNAVDNALHPLYDGEVALTKDGREKAAPEHTTENEKH